MDRPAHLMQEEAKVHRDAGMIRPVHIIDKDEIENSSQGGGLDIDSDINLLQTPGRVSLPGTPGQMMREFSVGLGSLRPSSSNPYNSGRQSSRRPTDGNLGGGSDDDDLLL